MKKLYWNNLTKSEQECILTRETQSEDDSLRLTVNEIITQVKTKGEQALKAYTLKFDNVALSNLFVSQDEFLKAKSQVSLKAKENIQFALARIRNNNLAQVPENVVIDSQDGVVCELQWRAITRVGLYVPGGTACLVSTLLMIAVPAMVAGCKEMVLCTPPSRDGSVMPEILVAAQMCGIQTILKVGGAQAIAAMSFGFGDFTKVDKIFGPGNRYVTQAKLLCSQQANGVSIDLPAGPSELLVIADKEANPCFVAADLLSQAEHDVSSQVILLSDNEGFVQEVIIELEKQLEKLPRRSIALASLQKSAAIIVKDIAQAIEISNAYAPEHVSLQIQKPRQYISAIQNAGAVFVGPWTAETLCDYVTGANHVLPTQGAAKSRSGLTLLEYMKTICVEEVSEKGFSMLAPFARAFADMEGLKGHENALSLRAEVQNDKG